MYGMGVSDPLWPKLYTKKEIQENTLSQLQAAVISLNLTALNLGLT
jgi:hypothetical protein